MRLPSVPCAAVRFDVELKTVGGFSAWLLREWVAGEGKGSGAGTTADLTELTHAALAFQIPLIAQSRKERRVTVKVDQRLLANRTSRQW